MRRRLSELFIALCVCLFLAGPASACPMCKEANEADDPRPRAYMYSIIFMIAVPATMFTGFGLSFYRLAKRGAPAPDPSDPDLSDD